MKGSSNLCRSVTPLSVMVASPRSYTFMPFRTNKYSMMTALTPSPPTHTQTHTFQNTILIPHTRSWNGVTVLYRAQSKGKQMTFQCGQRRAAVQVVVKCHAAVSSCHMMFCFCDFLMLFFFLIILRWMFLILNKITLMYSVSKTLYYVSRWMSSIYIYLFIISCLFVVCGLRRSQPLFCLILLWWTWTSMFFAIKKYWTLRHKSYNQHGNENYLLDEL